MNTLTRSLALALLLTAGTTEAQERDRTEINETTSPEAVVRVLKAKPRRLVIEAADGNSGGQITTQPVEVSVVAPLNFEFGKHDLTPEVRKILDIMVTALASPELSGVNFRVEGHTDSVGSAESNRLLSERRANSVRDYLVQRGINGSRLVSRGYGESAPLPGVESTNYRQRRVELVRIY